MPNSWPPAPETDKDAMLRNTDPHYSDTRWNRPQTIYGSNEGVTQYNYSDRLGGMPRHSLAWEKATQDHPTDHPTERTAAFYEAYLRHLWEDESIQLLHIMAGVNLSNGFSYLIWGYCKGDQNEVKTGGQN